MAFQSSEATFALTQQLRFLGDLGCSDTSWQDCGKDGQFRHKNLPSAPDSALFFP